MANLIPWNINLNQEIKDKFIIVKEVCPDAILAGGAIRDSFFEVPIKDIDIFVGPSFKIELLTKMDCELQHDEKLFEGYNKFGRNIKSVFGTKPTNDIPVQIISCLDSPVLDDLLNGFDWGFCQIGTVDGETFYSTKAFKDDVINNTATFTLGTDSDEKLYSLKRAMRFKIRYDKKDFMVPLSKEQMNLLAYNCDKFWGPNGNLNFTLA